MNDHFKETKIPLILYRWRGGYYKTDAEAVDAILEAVVAEAETIPVEHEGVLTKGIEKTARSFRWDLLKKLRGEQ